MSIQKEKSSEETLQGSWVELHFNTADPQGGSQAQIPSGLERDQAQIPSGLERDQAQIPSGLERDQAQIPSGLEPGDQLEKMLLDAQHESSRSSSKDGSQCNSPLRSQTPPHLYRGSEGNSSQSEEDYQERRGEVENPMKKNAADGIWHWSSRPENNPPREFQLKHPRRSSSLSIRNTSVMKKGGVLSPDFLKLFMPSLILSHILAVGLGIYIGRRLTTHSAY